MGFFRGPNIITDKLSLYLDAGNIKSYSGSGAVWGDLINSNNGSLLNSATVSSSNPKNIELDGVNQFATIPDPGVDNTDGFSVEIILKVSNFSNQPKIITPSSYGIDHFLTITTSGKVIFTVIPSADSTSYSVSTDSSLSSDKFSSITITYNSVLGSSIYFNGELEDSGKPSFTAVNWEGSWFIGQRGNSTKFLEGGIGLLKVYKKKLNDSEVLQNFIATKSRFKI